MSCYHPKHAMFRPGLRPNKKGEMTHGRPDIYPYSFHTEPCVDPFTGELLEEFTIPCGKCLGCFLDKSQQWACRVVMESLDYVDNYFITLTYDEDHVPRNCKSKYFNRSQQRWIDYATDDWMDVKTLSLEDYQNFFKRLRIGLLRYFGQDDPIRYFGCGEYGSTTLRPHYHLCVCNLKLQDLVPLGVNRIGQTLYSSDFLSNTWGNGHIAVAPLNFQTAAYTTRYCMKKATGDPYQFIDAGMPDQFQTMSRRPGLGRFWYDTHADSVWSSDKVVLPATSKDKAPTYRVPRYFDNILKREDPVRFAEVKKRRELVKSLADGVRADQTDLDDLGYFELQERSTAQRLTSLVRYL